MKTLKFEGYSDGTFGEYGWFDEDVDNYASMKPIQCLITSSEGRLLVVGQYAKTHISDTGCWVIGVLWLMKMSLSRIGLSASNLLNAATRQALKLMCRTMSSSPFTTTG